MCMMINKCYHSPQWINGQRVIAHIVAAESEDTKNQSWFKRNMVFIIHGVIWGPIGILILVHAVLHYQGKLRMVSTKYGYDNRITFERIQPHYKA